MKRLPLLALLFLVLSISSCNHDNGFDNRYVIKDVSRPCNISLCASDTTMRPTSVSIHFMGAVNGECAFDIENGTARYNTIKLKDSINYLYENEWYEPKINVKYLPDPKITGDSIVIEYQMQ